MKRFFAMLLAGCGLLAASAAPAQEWPAQNIRFVVPFTAGSATDTLARLLANHMQGTLGKSIIVENIVGASGITASQAVAKASPDGYTIMVTSNTTHASNQSMLKNVPYDAEKDFEPVTKLGNITLALVSHPSVPANNVKELIDYAKANPGKMSFGSGSTSARAAGEMLKTLAGIDLLHVPYKSNPLVVTDLLGGQIQLFFGDVSTSIPPVKTGKLKGYAVSSLKRSPLAPDLPTLDEAGIKGYDLTAWFAAFTPAKTPKPVVDKLNAAFRAALTDKEVSAKLNGAGIEPEGSTPEALKTFVSMEIKKWAKIVADAKIQPE